VSFPSISDWAVANVCGVVAVWCITVLPILFTDIPHPTLLCLLHKQGETVEDGSEKWHTMTMESEVK
jgi:hypothetical protein